MSLNKAVIMGKVIKTPEKRFTTQNLAIATFPMDIGKQDQPTIVRVVAMGKLAEVTADTVKKDKQIIVEGRLQTNTVKDSAGAEKKIIELSAQSIEVIGEAAPSSSSQEDNDVFNYDEQLSSDDLIGEDEIPF